MPLFDDVHLTTRSLFLHAGPSICEALVWAQLDGKTQTKATQTTGHAHSRAIIRAKDPVECALGQIARCEVAAAQANIVPPLDGDSNVGNFYRAFLFFKKNCLSQISSGAHGDDSKSLLREGAGVDVDGLSGHGARRLAAQILDNAGVSLEVRPLSMCSDLPRLSYMPRHLFIMYAPRVLALGKLITSMPPYTYSHALLPPFHALVSQLIARFGGWVFTEMFKYLELGLPPAPLLAAAGFPIESPFNMFFSFRFNIPVSPELQKLVLPVIGLMEEKLPAIDGLQGAGKPAFRQRLLILK